MPLFDVEFNRRIGHGAIDKGRAVVEADDKDSAKEAVLDRFGLSASGTMTSIDLIEDDVLLLSRKQLAEPSNPVTALPLLTKAERKEREIEKAYRQLQNQNKAPDKKPETLNKFLCNGHALIQALDEEHALRMFAEEMMARAKGHNKPTPHVNEVSININLTLDQRRRVQK